MQATDPDLLPRDVSLYTETISSPAQAPAVIHQAIAAAYAGRGVAHMTLLQDVVNARAEGSVSSLATLKPRPAARRLRSASSARCGRRSSRC
jgi:thiamine pyrophosphate-dependent acetolactate synthase large subunit-like protein